MQKARRHPEGLRPLVSARFQILFTPLIAVLFIVQSPYLSTIGCRVVLRIGGWTPHVQPGFHEPEPTQGLTGFRLQGFHLLWPRIPARSLVYRLIRVRSPLLTESLLLSFPVGTEMFQFPTFALHPYAFRVKYPKRDGLPHSDISGSRLVYQLPGAFRRLPRPSSPLDAKTSTVRP